MSRGRQLQAGDKATTDWNGEKTVTHVTIVRRVDGYSSGSGIAFQVKPRLKNGLNSSLYDADWFEPLPPTVELWGATLCGASHTNDGLA